jgi:putative endonuclease
MAAHYLKKQGFRVLYKNFRSPAGGEIDLVCRDCRQDCLVFVEVKRRQSHRFGPPSLAVQNSKQHLIVRGAFAWLRLLGSPQISCRFDIVEIIGEKPEIRHIQDAFPLPASIYGI